MTFKHPIISLALFITACAAPELPTYGTPTPHDGVWSGTLQSDHPGCRGARVMSEIRYGHWQGTVSKDGRKLADLWGKLKEDGRIEGLVGQLGISGGFAHVTFDRTTASGTWGSRGCRGTVTLRKIQ